MTVRVRAVLVREGLIAARRAAPALRSSRPRNATDSQSVAFERPSRRARPSARPV